MVGKFNGKLWASAKISVEDILSWNRGKLKDIEEIINKKDNKLTISANVYRWVLIILIRIASMGKYSLLYGNI